jgi:transcriptional regulator with XRE-family HTH domain
MTEQELITFIKETIAFKGLSYTDVGKPVGMTRQQVSNVLNNSSSPTFCTLYKIAKQAGVEISAKINQS